jgi:hypothetical protein
MVGRQPKMMVIPFGFPGAIPERHEDVMIFEN